MTRLDFNWLRAIVIAILISLLGLMGASAASLELVIHDSFAGKPLLLDSVQFQNGAGETLSISRVSYLLSGFALESADGGWLKLPGQYAWMDAAQERSGFRLDGIPPGLYRGLRFHIGPDATANVADPARWEAGHPLNPNLNGLYWSWQGGYIFLALEGRYRAPGGESKGFAYHLARDANRARINIPAELKLVDGLTLHLSFDVDALLDGPRRLSFEKDGVSTHSRPGDPIAAALLANLPESFHVEQVGSLSQTVDSPAKIKPLYLPEKFTPYHFKLSAAFPLPDLPRDNPLIEERVLLGQKLFQETALSKDGALSCSSCHSRQTAFADSRRYSLGVREQPGSRNAMPLFNLAWKNSFFWDGRAPLLRTQALMPIQDHKEMDETLTNVIQKLRAQTPGPRPSWPLTTRDDEDCIHSSAAGRRTIKADETSARHELDPDYPALFAAAFDSPEITAEKIGLALEQFLLTLSSCDSKFDRAFRGDGQVNAQEQRGLELFMTEYEPRTGQYGADCFHCHGGALFTDHQFHNNGLALTNDFGRFQITGRQADRGKFATPSLRNVALTAPYMHDGRFATLEQVVDHYSSRVVQSATLDPNLAKHPTGGVQLTAADQAALVAFLKCLTDEQFGDNERRSPATHLTSR
jgi:cytochrome c peroxidase